MRREAWRDVFPRSEDGSWIGKDIQLIALGVFDVLGIQKAIPVKRRYQLHAVLIRDGRELGFVVRRVRIVGRGPGGIPLASLLR